MMITLAAVTKIYRMGEDKIYALNDIKLDIKSGEYIAIMGPSGSGKSTLANIIGGLEKPDEGSVEIDGKDISRLKDKELSLYRNRTVGYIFQAFNLQPTFTALENVAMPLVFAGVGASERTRRAKEALKAVGLSDRMEHKPSQLSGGQRQRVSIARALAVNPKLLIADEPTGNLDTNRGKEIMQLISKLNKEQKLTIILITHDANMADYADKVIKLKDGKLIS